MGAVARKTKSYLTRDGRLHIVDPGPDHLPLIQRLIPGFLIASEKPPSGFVPNLVKTKAVRTGISASAIKTADEAILRQIHADGLAGRLNHTDERSANLFDLKVELARRELLSCELCGHHCKVNRFLKPGKCGLKDKAYVMEPFIHIAEEAVITPAATLKLFQCALNCAGCQSWEIIHRKESDMTAGGRLLNESIWSECAGFDQASTIEFVGGNPTESLLAIFSALSAMPQRLSTKPIVWNDHGYTTPVAYDLLNGVVDIYIPDFKGTDPCVERISKAPRYWDAVTKGVECMLRQNAKIIVRVLILPGHLFCCHGPSFEWLSRYRDQLWISLSEFIPDHQALKDPELNRPTSAEELATAQKIMKQLGLKNVDEPAGTFWKTLR